MTKVLLGSVVAVALVAALWAVLARYGAARWSDATGALVDRMEAARLLDRDARFDPSELAGLPAPAQRYFRAVLVDGQPIVTSARVRHEGTFDMGRSEPTWRPFTSDQTVVTRRPGFVWSGRVAMAPVVPVHVHDAYVAGEGILHAAILGLFPVVDLRGSGDVAVGELMRFFAEAAWYPAALLPSQGVRWTPVDERSASATLQDGALSLSMLFTFDAAGLIATVSTEARGRTVGDEIIPTPWEGRFWGYERRDGMLVPLEGEVSWRLPEGPKPYWRGRITQVAYAFSDGAPAGRRAASAR